MSRRTETVQQEQKRLELLDTILNAVRELSEMGLIRWEAKDDPETGVLISMTENGDPLENAIAERLNGILKDELLEEIYPGFDTAQHAVAVAVSTYNHQRPHGTISNYTPQEAHSLTGVEFKRLWKSYYKPGKKEVETQAV